MQVEMTRARIITIIDGLRAYIHTELASAPDWKAKVEVDSRVLPYSMAVKYLEGRLKVGEVCKCALSGEA